jgi:predicted acylesterase/phospholipase RssA
MSAEAGCVIRGSNKVFDVERLSKAVTRPGHPIAMLVMIVLIAGVQACSTPARLPAQPDDQLTQATVLGIPNARFYPDEQGAELFQEGMASVQKEMAALGVTDMSQLPPVYYLAISGGGGDGAFGAGLLNGWTETGTRPEFKLVTGISTGSLIAPFAFLGPDYDDDLKRVYTTIQDSDVYTERGITAVFDDDAMLDTTPLYDLISQIVDDEMMAGFAREYEKGRLLLIASTNLDARQTVIWNIGAIAASGKPGALELIHKILLASAAMPVGFPPVMFDVELDGVTYQEMHVDGGAVAQLILYPAAVGEKAKALMEQQHISRERHAYIIRNGKLTYETSPVERSTLPIAGQAVSTMISSSGINDLYRVYFICQEDGVDYNLAYIDSDFDLPEPDTLFDKTYMNALFDYGYDLGKTGYSWKKYPPYLNIEE